jgi:SAM-dependent methyltransferase
MGTEEKRRDKIELWYLEPDKCEQLAIEIAPYFEKKIIENLGKRKISSKELNELKLYWAASLAQETSFWYNGFTRSEFQLMTKEQKIEAILIEQDGTWDRAIRDYNQMAGQSIEEIIEKNIRENGRARLLDIGCGSLAFFDEVADKYQGKVECVGVSNAKPRERKGIKVVNSLAEALPEEWNDKFDLVTCFEASMYFYDNYRAFNEAVRVMKPEGKLLYGYGRLKSLGNDDLLERLLNVRDFQYIIKSEGSRNGEEHSGIFAKWLSVTYPFWDRLREIEDNGNMAEIECKKITMKTIPSRSWCRLTLVVEGLGKVSGKN